ncbi:DUF4190 domain-containing protein [Bacillus sp. FJAT-49732]|uniref:DUF4190 domain-containing protein n=1 Tax=Lederbergia citrisecunda TaxID=2833583 RepID=A0A942TQM2_9BACI|nr:DUF4190 domain-containing protein [Lederbergia citrisecunda]MBS4201106.1 DUF4190 domain-containing protein [Lederbergia citrisecunda]
MVEKAQTNSKSVISLTLGILSIFIPMFGIALGVIGLVFSRIGIKEIEKTNENGRGIATAGFICSIVGAVIHLLWILLDIFNWSSFSNV